MLYEINKVVMRSVKEKGQVCLCDLEKSCPCESFMENDDCECGLYKTMDIEMGDIDELSKRPIREIIDGYQGDKGNPDTFDKQD